MVISINHDLVPGLSRAGAGQVILLNGTSSSGKSSIATELVASLDGVWFGLGIDQFHRVRSRRDWTDEQFEPVFQRTVLGFHRAVAGMASVGNNVVMDYVLGERWRLDDCLDVLAGLPVLFVGLHCSLAELETRERRRGDRTVGLARAQFPLVHHHERYDVEVDTEEDDPETCAAAIRTRLAEGPGQAFATLRRDRRGSGAT